MSYECENHQGLPKATYGPGTDRDGCGHCHDNLVLLDDLLTQAIEADDDEDLPTLHATCVNCGERIYRAHGLWSHYSEHAQVRVLCKEGDATRVAAPSDDHALAAFAWQAVRKSGLEPTPLKGFE